MRNGLVVASALVTFVACQTREQGTPETVAASDAGAPPDQSVETPEVVEPDAPAATPEESSALTSSEQPPAEAPGEAVAMGAEGLDCSLDVALACSDTEVDGCLTGQTTVHRCVSMDDDL